MRCAMLANLCQVSQGMGVRKVSTVFNCPVTMIARIKTENGPHDSKHTPFCYPSARKRHDTVYQRIKSDNLLQLLQIHQLINGGPKMYKRLCCHIGTARRSLLANSCYVSRGIVVRKVSISKSDL